jgi:hypothetical protein
VAEAGVLEVADTGLLAGVVGDSSLGFFDSGSDSGSESSESAQEHYVISTNTLLHYMNKLLTIL